jgi:hypothetical protein
MRLLIAILPFALLLAETTSAQSLQSLKAKQESLKAEREKHQKAQNRHQREVKRLTEEIEVMRLRIADAEYRDAESAEVKVLTESGVDLHAEPSVRAEVVTKLPKGTHEAIDHNGVYFKVRHDGRVGWVSDNYVSESPSAKAMMREAERKREAEEAAEVTEEERRLEDLRAQGYGIELNDFDFRTNSAGGVSPIVRLTNIDQSSALKYVWFTLRPYNGVGDPVKGRTRNRDTRTMRATGPVYPGDQDRMGFKNAWYNGRIECIEIRKIRVLRMDGSQFTYVNDLADISTHAEDINLRGDCQ